jgi:hypothetical protein
MLIFFINRIFHLISTTYANEKERGKRISPHKSALGESCRANSGFCTAQ